MNNPVLKMFRRDADSQDLFGSVQDWRFTICEALLFDWGTLVPGFRTMATKPDPDSFMMEELRTLYRLEDDSIPMEDWHVEKELLYALKILDRYRIWIGLAGEDY